MVFSNLEKLQEFLDLLAPGCPHLGFGENFEAIQAQLALLDVVFDFACAESPPAGCIQDNMAVQAGGKLQRGGMVTDIILFGNWMRFHRFSFRWNQKGLKRIPGGNFLSPYRMVAAGLLPSSEQKSTTDQSVYRGTILSNLLKRKNPPFGG
jgi:hypothetical protein